MQGSGKRKRLEQAQSLELLHGGDYEGLSVVGKSEHHSLMSPMWTIPHSLSQAPEDVLPENEGGFIEML